MDLDYISWSAAKTSEGTAPRCNRIRSYLTAWRGRALWSSSHRRC